MTNPERVGIARAATLCWFFSLAHRTIAGILVQVRTPRVRSVRKKTRATLLDRTESGVTWVTVTNGDKWMALVQILAQPA